MTFDKYESDGKFMLVRQKESYVCDGAIGRGYCEEITQWDTPVEREYYIRCKELETYLTYKNETINSLANELYELGTLGGALRNLWRVLRGKENESNH